jgi:hypothetical protein
MIIKDPIEKIEQTKEEVIRLKDDLKKGMIISIEISVERLENILDLLFDNDNYTSAK